MGSATTLERALPRPPAREGDAGGLGGAVFAVLVLACFAAFFITQRLKHTPTAVQRIMMAGAFSPTPFGKHKQERISFRIAQADEVTVEVIDNATGASVATLLEQQPVPRYHQYRVIWNGHSGLLARGPLAPEGYYRARITLRRQHRSVLSPRTFRLVLTHPQH
jgi:hypothetical protein